MDPSLCNRKRPCGGAALQLHQEAQCQPPACKRRRSGVLCKENTPSAEDLQRAVRTQTVKTEPRPFSQFGSRTTSGFQLCRPEVKVALIRKTRILTSVQTPGSIETQMDQIKSESNSGANSRSTQRPLSTTGLVSDQSSETRISRRRSKRVLGPEEEPLKIRYRSETRTRRSRKINPSVFRGRGQLQLSITPEVGQLIIHIHRARGLMMSCDSYVKVEVTSDLRTTRMKTSTVLNHKNPEYNHKFTLILSDDLISNRLLVSVFSRSRQLIGSMSFGIGSLFSSSTLVTGWFYLLGEEFGRTKHLRVTSQRNKPMRSPEDVPTADLGSTPDSTPEMDLNRITSSTATTATNLNHMTTATALKDPTKSCSYVSMLSVNGNQRYATQDSSRSQQLTVNVLRGKDGFGFTICSDCPVRVQAVDPGGPAHRSGLRQGDSVLQLNGLPVQTWKCVDLAHAIRSCSSQIVLVVWRGSPELRSGCESLLCPPTHNQTTGRKLLPHPGHSKHCRRRGQGSGVRSSLGVLGGLWKDRKEDQDEDQEVTEYSTCTATLKGTRMTSSHGDNYIILSPVNSGGPLLQPVYQDQNGTIGSLYQTNPRRDQNLFHDPRPGLSQRLFTGCTSTLPTSTSSVRHSDYGNYQNCTIVQSHLPCSTYQTYVPLPPKTLIFPIFVQPLDLCSPDRTLLMSEELVLHQTDLAPSKVTVLIYTDLLLFTREDEAGRCNVLQSPLYLNTLQLREVASEPLRLYFLQSSQGCWRCVFSLEAFSIKQRLRVSLCLNDNIQLQLVAAETGHSQQLSDLPSEFGLLSVGQSDLLYRPSSPYSSSDAPLLLPSTLFDTLRPASPSPYSSSSPFSSSTPPPTFSSLSPYTFPCSPPSRAFISSAQLLPPPSPSSTHSPVWKERGEAEEERRKRRQEEMEERQMGEGESASEISESLGGIKMKEEEEEESDEEEGGGAEDFTSSYRPAVLRRVLSEGSLLQEPRSPRFLSDSTIHQITRPITFDLDPSPTPTPQPTSVHALRNQLSREGGSLHHMLLLLNGTKDVEFRNLQLRKKTRNLAAEVQSRLLFLRPSIFSNRIHSNSLEKAVRNNRPSTMEVLTWAESLEALLTNQYGLAVFRYFLRSEFSEENLDFWLAVEKFKRTRPLSKMAAKAMKIYDEFISTNASRQVNVDSSVRELTNQGLQVGVNPVTFQLAQDQIFDLMKTDSYARFLRSRLYSQLANQGVQTATESSNQSTTGAVAVGQS